MDLFLAVKLAALLYLARLLAVCNGVPVRSAEELNAALLLPSIEIITITDDIDTNNVAIWTVVTLSRPVQVVGSAGSMLTLPTSRVLITLRPGADLAFANVTISCATSSSTHTVDEGPLPAINATYGSLSLTSVVLYTELSETKTPFWNQSNILGSLQDANSRVPVTRLAGLSTAALLISYSQNQTQITNTVLLPKVSTSCYTVGTPVHSSERLAQVLAASSSRSIFVFQSILLQPAHFNFTNQINVTKPVEVYSCAGTQLDFNYNYTRASIMVKSGGQLQLRTLQIINSKALNRLWWPSQAAALPSAIDVSYGGTVVMLNVNISTPDNENPAVYFSQGDAKGAFDYEVQLPGKVLIRSWNLDITSWPDSPGILLNQNALWQLINVTVTFASTSSCFPSSGAIRVNSGTQLRALLTDSFISNIEIAGDITFVESEWPPAGAGPSTSELNITASRTVEVRACHPIPGQRYNIDFGDLGQIIFVFGTLTWKGDMHMVRPRASPRRAWLYLLVGVMSVETDGVILFEDVVIEGNTTSPFHNLADPYWSIQCHDQCAAVQPDLHDFYNASYYDAYIYSYRFYKQEWVNITQGRDIPGTGYWGYTDVSLIWRPPGSEDSGGSSVPLAAVVVPVVCGSVLLILAVLGLVLCCKRRRRESDSSQTYRAGSLAADATKLSKDMEHSGSAPTVAGSPKGVGLLNNSSIGTGAEARIEDMKRTLNLAQNASTRNEHLVLAEVLGQGTFGKVYKGYWRGTLVAIKCMLFPANMSGKEKREKMAVMETAISSLLSHPNVVQTYTYTIRPIAAENHNRPTSDTLPVETLEEQSQLFLTSDSSTSDVHSWEVRIVLELCDRGSLRDALDRGVFLRPDGTLDFAAMLDTALDVARAMLHLHSESIIHSDLKARNILLKSAGSEGRGFCAKVADFGLSLQIDHLETHVSNVYQGTITHMAPEMLLHGQVGKASDVYAFGILLWEIFTAGHAFKGTPRALLGHEVTKQNRRPEFTGAVPFDYQLLAFRCWESDPGIRPNFSQVLEELQRLRLKLSLDNVAGLAGGDGANLTSRPSGQAADMSGAWLGSASFNLTDPHGTSVGSGSGQDSGIALGDTMSGLGVRRLPYLQPIHEDAALAHAPVPSSAGPHVQAEHESRGTWDGAFSIEQL